MPASSPSERGGVERRRPRPAVALAIVVAFLVATNTAGWAVYLAAREALLEEQADRLVTIARVEAEHVPHLDAAVLAAELERLREVSGLHDIFVLDRERRIVAAARPDRRERVGREDLVLRVDAYEIGRALEGEALAAVPYRAEGRPIRRAYAPILEGGRVVGVVGIAAPAGAFVRFERLGTLLWGVAIASAVLAAVLFAAYRRWGRYLRGVALKLEHQERLATIGAMAATVAHEVRNPLGIIRATADVLERENPLGESARELVEDIRAEVARLDGVVTGLLDLARPPRLDLSDVDLNALAARVLHDWERGRRGGGPEARCDAEAGLGMIRADARRLRQALLNLVLNAAEAAGEEGRIEVRTRRVRGGVEIAVADDGPGVPADARDRLFEPFFSTKPRGAGLGLAVVRSVVEAHGGTIDVRSREGRGTEFVVRLPDRPPETA